MCETVSHPHGRCVAVPPGLPPSIPPPAVNVLDGATAALETQLAALAATGDASALLNSMALAVMVLQVGELPRGGGGG